ncbi:MAG: hypothetical protein LC792_25160, partial [Actinobacteria bacterium]|nr:hypothetical protein [Actinomycetota bacterium]
MNDIPRPTSTIVPLADRVRYMRLFRLAAVALVVACKVAAPGLLRGSTHQVFVGTGCFLGVSVAGEVLWRLLGRRNLRLLGVMPIVDGAYLAWLSFVTGATVSPARYLIVVYLVAVVLLVSYRTGLKVACWESIALLVLYN